MKKTVVLGASPNPARYAYMAIIRLLAAGHEVLPLGTRKGFIEDVPIITDWPSEVSDVHTLTLYLNPQRQSAYYDYMLDALSPERVIFNPGTENPIFMEMLASRKVEYVLGCTLVMLSTSTY